MFATLSPVLTNVVFLSNIRVSYFKSCLDQRDVCLKYARTIIIHCECPPTMHLWHVGPYCCQVRLPVGQHCWRISGADGPGREASWWCQAASGAARREDQLLLGRGRVHEYYHPQCYAADSRHGLQGDSWLTRVPIHTCSPRTMQVHAFATFCVVFDDKLLWEIMECIFFVVLSFWNKSPTKCIEAIELNYTAAGGH